MDDPIVPLPPFEDPRARVIAAFDALDALDDPAVFIATADRSVALEALDESRPLAGLTFVVKNNIDVFGFDTTAGCPSFGYAPTESSPAVQRLVDAGATCLGVTNLDQFATGLVGVRSPYGVPKNAVDDSLVPGGSSAGSAVAVALGIADLGLGTDTAGSGRVPAAQNRIVGIKPTRGRLPLKGVVPAVQSLDCVSIFATSLPMASIGLETCSGVEPADPWSRPAGRTPMVPPTLRIGVPTLAHFSTDLDRAAWTATVAELAELAHVDIVDVDIAPLVEAGAMLYGGPWVAERYAAVGSFLDTEPPDADPTVASIIRPAIERTAVEAYEASYRLAEISATADDLWGEVDVIVTPTTPGVATLAEVEADPVGRNSELGYYTNWVNLLDQAAVAIPGCDRGDGRPFGITLLGRAWSEPTLIELGSRLLHAGSTETSEPAPFANDGGVDVVVVGAHLDGQPLNWQLTEGRGRFVRRTHTAPAYRFYALANSSPPKPGLVHVGSGGASIEVEVWRLPSASLGRFSQYIPAPLGLGRIELADGESVTGFIMEPRGADGAEDITHHGGWRSYLASLVG